MNPKPREITFLNCRGWPGRVGLLVLVAAAFVFGWFSVRWQLGDMIASLTSPADKNAAALARTAVAFSPRDPSAHWLAAVVSTESPSLRTVPNAAKAMETVVRLSPNNFHWWLELGRASEQEAKSEKAEMAFLKAVKLAPAYTLPRWQLGNFLLRLRKPDRAFRELKKAAESDPVYREQVFSIAWDYFDRDPKRLEEIVGNSPDVRVGLAKYYAGKDLPDRSLAMWNSVSEAVRHRNLGVGKLIARALFERRFLNASLEMIDQLGIEHGVRAGTVQNSGFEKPIARKGPVFFGWKISPEDRLRIRPSRSKRHSGKRSLQVSFSGYDKAEISNIYQTLALRPDTSYELTFWVLTEGLKSAGTPVVEVLDARTSKIIAGSNAFPTGSADWTKFSVRFRSTSESDGVMIRTARSYCGEKCPIFGTIWYDDFDITEQEPAE